MPNFRFSNQNSIYFGTIERQKNLAKIEDVRANRIMYARLRSEDEKLKIQKRALLNAKLKEMALRKQPKNKKKKKQRQGRSRSKSVIQSEIAYLKEGKNP